MRVIILISILSVSCSMYLPCALDSYNLHQAECDYDGCSNLGNDGWGCISVRACASGFQFYPCPEPPTACNASKYSLGGVCISCTANSYCPGDFFLPHKCTDCGSGMYQKKVCSSTSDAICSSCTKCNAGFYVSSGCNGTLVDSACSACPTGSFFCSGGYSSYSKCSICTDGSSYQTRACNAMNDTTCNACYSCPKGYTKLTTCSGTKDTTCAKCSLPYVCTGGDAPPMLCPDGNVCIDTGKLTPCPAGYWCVAGTVNMCDIVGTYCGQGSIDAVFCAPGYYCPNTAVQIICPAGLACQEGTSDLNMLECSPGSFCPQGTAVEIPCPSGFYCPTVTNQVRCEPGYYCVSGSVAPTACGIGSFCPNASDTDTPCASGRYCPSTTLSIECPIGFFCISGSTVASTCPSGFYCPIKTTTPLECNIPGSFCDFGSFVEKKCPPGFFCRDALTKIQCPLGSFCKQGVTQPTQCNNNGSTFCGEGSSEENACPAGSVCVSSSVATPCPLGSSCQNGSSRQCPPATYSNESGASVCAECWGGSYSTATGATLSRSCFQCSNQTFSSTASTTCTQCPEGLVSDAGAIKCSFPRGYRFPSVIVMQGGMSTIPEFTNLSSVRWVVRFVAGSTDSIQFPSPVKASILVVAGGGAGSAPDQTSYSKGMANGGGGAGAMILKFDVALEANTKYTITVGRGGAGGTGSSGNAGMDSSISANDTFMFLAKGGGGGAGSSGPDGGSGGGVLNGNLAPAVSSNIPNGVYGNIGGSGWFESGGFCAAGGGGGKSGPGKWGIKYSGAGHGGDGQVSDITGRFVAYAAGGAGGCGILTPCVFGIGGGVTLPGGTRLVSGGSSNANNAVANTGSGGAGGVVIGGDGAGGSVVIAWDPVSVPCPMGSYSSAIGSIACVRCSSGSYASAEASTACSRCNPGTYSGLGAAVCTACSGSCSNITSLRCSNSGVPTCCGEGTYFVEGLSSSCRKCSSGTYANLSATACFSCPKCIITTTTATPTTSTAPVPTTSSFNHNFFRFAGPSPGGYQQVPVTTGGVLGFVRHSNRMYAEFNASDVITFSSDINATVLAVGGGGAGATLSQGGGGAGAVVLVNGVMLRHDTKYTIQVGLGGLGALSTTTNEGIIVGLGAFGGSSSVSLDGFPLVLAIGGGAGGSGDGGCGGGNTANFVDAMVRAPVGKAVSTNIPAGKYGFDGGAAISGVQASSGGGGAGGSGTSPSLGQGGSGGAAVVVDIIGMPMAFAGGGAGTCAGRCWGAGGGATINRTFTVVGGGVGYTGKNGVPNTGSGGAASEYIQNSIAGSGGSGKVIIVWEPYFTQCPNGTYSGIGATVCTECPFETHSPAGASLCTSNNATKSGAFTFEETTLETIIQTTNTTQTADTDTYSENITSGYSISEGLRLETNPDTTRLTKSGGAIPTETDTSVHLTSFNPTTKIQVTNTDLTSFNPTTKIQVTNTNLTSFIPTTKIQGTNTSMTTDTHFKSTSSHYPTTITMQASNTSIPTEAYSKNTTFKTNTASTPPSSTPLVIPEMVFIETKTEIALANTEEEVCANRDGLVSAVVLAMQAAFNVPFSGEISTINNKNMTQVCGNITVNKRRLLQIQSTAKIDTKSDVTISAQEANLVNTTRSNDLIQKQINTNGTLKAIGVNSSVDMRRSGPITSDAPPDTGMSPGVMIGIVLGALFGVSLMGFCCTHQRTIILLIRGHGTRSKFHIAHSNGQYTLVMPKIERGSVL